MRKLIVQVRVNEGQMRDANPHVPYAPEEIAQTVVECWRGGASVVHWHAREPGSGAMSTDAALYVEAARLIKRQCDIVLFPTLGANPFPLHAYAIAKGGHVAVGLGDHPYPEFGHPTNAQLVERVVQMANSMGREISSAAEVRQLFGLNS